MMNCALSLVASVITGAARVGLGILWLNEGLFKLKAGFGGADIGLVVDSTVSNNRVPDFFEAFTTTFLGGAPDFFGWAIPALEVGLGIALILGVLTLPAALMSAFTLLTYWLADQLIQEYPIMLALSVFTPCSWSVLHEFRLRRSSRRPCCAGNPSRAGSWLL